MVKGKDGRHLLVWSTKCRRSCELICHKTSKQPINSVLNGSHLSRKNLYVEIFKKMFECVNIMVMVLVSYKGK